MQTSDDRQFYDLLQRSPVGIALENLEGQPIFVNPALCTMLGFSEEEMCSKHCVDFSPPEDAEKDWALFQQLRDGTLNHYKLDKRFRRRDGSLIWGRLNISLMNRPSPMVVAMVEDITEEKTQRDLASRLAAIVESSDDAIISKTLEGIIKSWNAGAQRIFGYTAAEVIGHPITILIPPELREEENKILGILRAGGRLEHYETVRVTKTGTKVDVSLSISPIKDSTGRIEGISKIARDISERKKAEKALTDMTRKLIEAQEQERARIGRDLHDDISQRLAMLASDIDELIKNPFEVKARVEEVQGHLGDILADIQALSHNLHSSRLELLGVMAGMKSWCQEFAKRQKMDIAFKGEVRNRIPLETGRSLFRVLQEALHNARKHSGTNRVEVQLREDSGEINLTVSDSGKGFDVEAAKQGNGLGLTSMQERVRLINGRITIEAKPMGGTTIRVSVPA